MPRTIQSSIKTVEMCADRVNVERDVVQWYSRCTSPHHYVLKEFEWRGCVGAPGLELCEDIVHSEQDIRARELRYASVEVVQFNMYMSTICSKFATYSPITCLYASLSTSH